MFQKRHNQVASNRATTSDVREHLQAICILHPDLRVRTPMFGMMRLQLESRRHGTHVLYEFLDARDGWRQRRWDYPAQSLRRWSAVSRSDLGSVHWEIAKALDEAGLTPTTEADIAQLRKTAAREMAEREERMHKGRF